MKIKSILLCTFCVAVASISAAQVIIRQAGASMGTLVLRKDVQDDLGLDSETRTKLKKAYDRAMADNDVDVQDHGGGTTVMRGMGMAKANEEFLAAAMKLLTAPQKARLKQIKLQATSYAALDDDEIETALKLNDGQRKQIADLKAKAQKEQTDLFRAAGNSLSEETMGKVTAIQKKLIVDLGKVLTAAQQAEFKKLQGKPFKGKLN